MSRKNWKTYIALLLCAALLAGLFSACGGEDTDPEESGTAPSLVLPDADGSQGAETISLLYDPADNLNPYTCTTDSNQMVTGLLFQGLFAIDQERQAQPALCSRYTTTDGQSYVFTLASATFTDGSALTAADVVYSLELAAESSRYGSRFTHMTGVSAQADGTVLLTLDKTNYQLPLLLDVPIVKSGTGSDDLPVGTGPYMAADLTETGGSLAAYAGYWDGGSLPAQEIRLAVYTKEEVTLAFEQGDLSLVRYDPVSEGEVAYGGNTETHFYDTTILQYVGFNYDSGFFSSAQRRRAVAYGIDSATIAADCMEGYGVAATIPLLPSDPQYGELSAYMGSYSLRTLSELLDEDGVADYNSDGKLEYLSGDTPVTIELDFIVNAESTAKVAAAETITAALQSAGLDVTLRTLSYDDYVSALASGDFDMYYGEVRLTSDLDLSPLLTASGSLNYGDIDDEQFAQLIDTCYAAAGEATYTAARSALYEYIAAQAPIATVLFRRGSVLTQRGAITGLTPTYQNVFYNITGWELH